MPRKKSKGIIVAKVNAEELYEKQLEDAVKQYNRSLKEQGIECKCIRCREAGHKLRENKVPENIEIRTEEYRASGGKEFFISAEDFDQDILIGYLNKL